MSVMDVVIYTDKKRSFRMLLDPVFFSQGVMLGEILNGKAYEEATSVILANVLAEGDGFVDIGAHQGWFTLLACSLAGDSGYVVAVEPLLENVEALRENLTMNGWLDRVECVSAVAGSEDGEADFWVNLDNEGGGALWDVSLHDFNEKTRAGNPGTIKVPMVTLDKILDDMPVPVKAIKIDTEGAEVAVLKGCARWLSSGKIPYIVAEVHEMGLELMGSSPAALVELMDGYGYKCYQLEEYKPGEVYNVLFSNLPIVLDEADAGGDSEVT